MRTQRANKRFTCKSANVCGFVLVENPLLDPNLLGVVSEPGLVLRRFPLRARDREQGTAVGAVVTLQGSPE